MDNLEKIKKIRINDYTEYDQSRCNNGGCYGFWTNYDRIDNGWSVSYGTTADLDYCPVCGNFTNHYVGDDDCDFLCGDYKVISDEEMLKIVNSFEEKDGCWIDVDEDRENAQ